MPDSTSNDDAHTRTENVPVTAGEQRPRDRTPSVDGAGGGIPAEGAGPRDGSVPARQSPDEPAHGEGNVGGRLMEEGRHGQTAHEAGHPSTLEWLGTALSTSAEVRTHLAYLLGLALDGFGRSMANRWAMLASSMTINGFDGMSRIWAGAAEQARSYRAGRPIEVARLGRSMLDASRFLLQIGTTATTISAIDPNNPNQKFVQLDRYGAQAAGYSSYAAASASLIEFAAAVRDLTSEQEGNPVERVGRAVGHALRDAGNRTKLVDAVALFVEGAGRHYQVYPAIVAGAAVQSGHYALSAALNAYQRPGDPLERAAAGTAEAGMYSAFAVSIGTTWSAVDPDNPNPRTVRVERDVLRIAGYTSYGAAALAGAVTGIAASRVPARAQAREQPGRATPSLSATGSTRQGEPDGRRAMVAAAGLRTSRSPRPTRASTSLRPSPQGSGHTHTTALAR